MSEASFARRLRTRGFTLMETVLVIAVGLGLLIGGIIFYQQAQSGSDQTDKTRAAVALSSEIRAQFRTAADFSGATNAAVSTAASLPASMFNNVTIGAVAGPPPQFTLSFANLNAKVCSRMAANPNDLGAGVASAACTATTLLVTYNR